ncbi:MAG: fibronectin type III domain-containing protein [Pseudonocardiaceae bacterium]
MAGTLPNSARVGGYVVWHPVSLPEGYHALPQGQAWRTPADGWQRTLPPGHRVIGSPVLSYTVTSNPGGLTASGPAGPITVTGLTNGVSYTFTVIAANANGTSQPSSPSNAVTPTAPPAPANDDIAHAQAISGDSGTVTGSNVGATLEPGEPHSEGNTGGASIWYVWTPATGGGSATFNTCGTNFPPNLGVYQIADNGSPVSVTNLDNVFPGFPQVRCPDGSVAPGIQPDINQAGGTYYIQVDGNNTGNGAPTGPITLSWSKP